jgi:hypothetical protein
MREPIPFRRPVRATFVESNGHVNGNGRPHVPEPVLDLDDEEETPDDFFADEFDDDEDERADAESLREVASNEAPWSPVPVRPAREFIRQNEDATLGIVFPTVYDEDRPSKMKDLTTAQAVAAITHQRMAEQMAKELGFEQYDYDAEIQAIRLEAKRLPDGTVSAVDQVAGVDPTKPDTPEEASKMAAPTMPGAVPSMKVGAPTPGLQGDDEPQPSRRAPLSGDSKAEFRKDQRSTQHLAESLRAEVSENMRELRALIASGRNSETTTQLVEALVSAFSRLETTLATPPAVNVEVPTPQQPVVNVEVPPSPRPIVVALESETPARHVQIIRDERGLITEMREVETKPRPASPERLMDVIDSAFARFEERAGSTDRGAARDRLTESITSALLAQFAQRRNVKVIRDERGLITEMRDES